jgi:4-alpha-glucanotransferase
MEFRGYCHQKKVGLIGDIPIYVSFDSADVWAHQDLFRMDSRGRPKVVAGVPPDYFSKTGQLWGNPIYRWDVLRRRKYDWWIKRIRSRIEKFDALRLDHFIGFYRYWELSGHARTAKNGHWARGPGADFFRQIMRQIGPVEFIAEDLGSLTPGVIALRDKFGFPGMRVLQFEFGTESEAFGGSLTIPSRCVLYTGTHDNDTIIGWLNEKGGSGSQRSDKRIRKEREIALRASASDGREVHWDMIRFAFESKADLVIIPLQDVLGLGSQARMNRPGIERRNWAWRYRKGQLRKKHAKRLVRLAEINDRLPRL